MSDPVIRLNVALQGRYRIERELGEGGMATVYLADDLKHERKVALKVLKPELAAVVGAERFLAEIKVTANLQHPHILPLFDSGEAEGFLFYVMPYVEGETLRDRIDREKQLPVDEAVALASKVAGALQHAHEHGVIHRDIKPGNILLQDGEPVVADFGIALAVGAAGSNRLTETGLSLGTPYYMSPEQATGDQAVGASTDTYALGSVLYEMLVGEPPYPGTTAQAVLGRIIAGEPVSAVKHRASIPPNVDAAIRKALEKLPADRFVGAQEFARALDDPGFRHGEEAAVDAAASTGLWKVWAMAATGLALVLGATLGWSLLRPEPPGLLARFSVAYEVGLGLGGLGVWMEFTADDAALVYAGPAESGVGPQLWMRRWSDLDAAPIRGTEGAATFALSPDGREVAFAPVAGPLRVVSLDGGAPRTLVEQVTLVSDWAPDGTVYFTETVGLMLRRVPATGGGTDAVETVTELLDRETMHGSLQVLPGGRMAVFQVWYSSTGVDAEIWVMDLDTQERSFLTSGGSPRYASTGHLLFATPDGVLMAAPFDPGTAELTGAPVQVAEDLRLNPVFGIATYDVSRNGSLVYAGWASSSSGAPMIWVSRNGSEEVLDPAFTGLFEAPSVSPDGRRVAVQRQLRDAPEDIWIYDFDQETFTRLTFGGSRNLQPFWNPDGTEVGFSSNREGAFALYARSADLSSETRLLVAAGDAPGLYTGVWTPDGRWLIYRRGSPTTSGAADLWYVAPDPDSTPVAFLETDYLEYSPSISPDGRWLAYSSNESGQFEVYVRPFPGPGGQSQVSVNGARNAVWARSGREIYYISSDLSLTVATFRTDPTLAVESREQLTSWPYFLRSTNRDYDLAPDDQRFLAVDLASTEAQQQLILVQNFFEELRQRMGSN